MVEMQEMFESFERARQSANVSTVFGAPVTVEGQTIIPVASVAYGFGTGFGQGEAEHREQKDEETGEPQLSGGAGGGAGAMARPLAYIRFTPDGPRVEPVLDEQRLSLAAILLAAWGIFWTASTLITLIASRRK